ncbi:MAG: hypothetical protein WDA16_00370 [Candidatus Thermoplasmatota archaeon]
MQQTENLAPHVNEIARALQNKLEAGAIEDELRRYLDYGVPLAQAKRDIVRMHGGTLQVGAKKVSDLQPEDRGVDVTAKILTVNPKTITVKGAPKEITYGYLADETGKAPYTAWKDLQLERGAVYKIRNAYVKKGFREGVDVQLGDYTTAERSDVQLDVKDDYVGASTSPSGDYAGSRIATEKKVRDLNENDRSVSVIARVLEIREKTISTANGQKTIVEGVIADETGRVPFSAWEPEKLPAEFKENAVAHIRSAYVKTFRNVPQINIGQYATIEMLSSVALPSAEALSAPTKRTLDELERSGGGQGIVVEGIVLEVKKGSGLIFRCNIDGCNRVLQNRQCALHPQKQEGIPDLRVKAVVDDGLGAATFFANREATERLIGKTLAECQQQAGKAMTVDVIQDDIDRVLTAKRVLVSGNALCGEFGMQIIASGIEFVQARDVTADAERLLGELAAFLPEVSQ